MATTPTSPGRTTATATTQATAAQTAETVTTAPDPGALAPPGQMSAPMLAALLQALQGPGNEALLAALVATNVAPPGSPPQQGTAAPRGVLRNASAVTPTTPSTGRAVAFMDADAANALHATGTMPRVLDSALAAAATTTAAAPAPTENSADEDDYTTLVDALRTTAADGSEDEDVEADLAFQGGDKPAVAATYRDALASIAEASPVMAMTEGVFAVTLIHSLFQHHAPARNRDEYAGAYIAFIGDRDGESDPSAVKIKPGLMTWKETAMIADYGDNSAIDKHYNTPGNRNTFFDAGTEQKAIQKVWIPKMPTPPAELALTIAETETTPWELHGLIELWEEDRSDAVKALMVPLKNWCIYATTKGTTTDTSAVAVNPPLLHRPSQELRNAMLTRLDGTLGEQ